MHCQRPRGASSVNKGRQCSLLSFSVTVVNAEKTQLINKKAQRCPNKPQISQQLKQLNAILTLKAAIGNWLFKINL